MRYSIMIHGKRMQVVVSKTAEKELAIRHRPVVVVVHLIFGCMVAKRVWFKDETLEESVNLTDKLSIFFDVVRYANCSFSNIDGGAEPEKYPLKHDIKTYVPDFLSIDFIKNKLSGDFTFSRSKSPMEEFFE